MATVSATVEVVTSLPNTTTFRAVFTITAQTDFPDDKLLVLRDLDDKFDRVATIYDLSAWPAVKTPGSEFYRANTVTVDYDAASAGWQGIEDTKSRIEALVEQYASFKGSFDADQTVTYTATY